MIDISDLRREFLLKSLDEKDVSPDPIVQFESWLREAIESNIMEPNAMALATVGLDLRPSCRIVLLKKVNNDGFVFFTNYDSRKGDQIDANPYCALTFAWHELERQVRIEGRVEKLSSEGSDAYFEVRPVASKLGTWASPQSKKIPNRLYLEELVFAFDSKFKNKSIKRPENWGGYILKPSLIEFWQGRASRLHDRVQYDWSHSSWTISRLAP